MARKSAIRKLTRREAVALIGAGSVIGTAWVAPVDAREAPQAHPSCEKPASVNHYSSVVGKDTRNVLISASCCEETKTAVLVGVEEPGKKPTTRTKMHLQPIQNELNAATLEEYCFMIWGLTEAQVTQFNELVVKNMSLKTGTTKK